MRKIIEKTAGEALLLEQFLRREMNLTKRQVRQAKFRESGISVNGRSCRVTEHLRPGDQVAVVLEDETMSPSALLPCSLPLEILYEDEDLLLVNKPAGIVVHPSHGHYQDTLSNMLVHYFNEKKEQIRIRSVGRLDKDTSGIVVFAKNQAAAGILARQREAGIFRKEYLAFSSGKMDEEGGCVRHSICKEKGSLMKMRTAVPEETDLDVKHAVTEYEVLSSSETASFLRLYLQTGRTHQIRVHMAYQGHPLLGDRLYGECSPLIERTALHAAKVELNHPFSEKRLIINAPLPEDMEVLMKLTVIGRNAQKQPEYS